jgi:type I restriction enzyme S subunit
MSKVKIIPELRFPEFKNDGEWVENSLEEVATFLKGKGISKADIVENGNLPCIRYGELYTHYNETISAIKSYTNSNINDLVLSEANDVIIPASGETQIDIATASCVIDNGIALGSDLNIIRSKINGVFLSYYLNNVKKKEIAQMAQGIAVVHLYPNQLKTLKIQIPYPKEQQKIASCLSSLDEIIATHSQKLNLLKDHKKGMMQNLFPQEGEKVPKYRFREFEKDGEWVLMKLENYIDLAGIMNISSLPISKFNLLNLLIKKFNLNIKLIKNINYKSNKILNSDIFHKIIGQQQLVWQDMLDDLKHDYISNQIYHN